MTKWVVHKKSRTPGLVSYTGATWSNIPNFIKYKEQYDNYEEAVFVAEALSKKNPVEFTVSEAGETSGRDVC